MTQHWKHDFGEDLVTSNTKCLQIYSEQCAFSGHGLNQMSHRDCSGSFCINFKDRANMWIFQHTTWSCVYKVIFSPCYMPYFSHYDMLFHFDGSNVVLSLSIANHTLHVLGKPYISTVYFTWLVGTPLGHRFGVDYLPITPLLIERGNK